MIRKNNSPPSLKKEKVLPIFLRRIMYKVRQDSFPHGGIVELTCNAYSPLPFKKKFR